MNLTLSVTGDVQLLLLIFNVWKGFKDGLALEDEGKCKSASVILPAA